MDNVNKFVLPCNKKYNFRMVKEYKLETENIGSQVKFLAAVKGYTMVRLKEAVNNLYNKTDGVKNLNNKIRNKTLRVSELAEIASVLGYEIILRETE